MAGDWILVAVASLLGYGFGYGLTSTHILHTYVFYIQYMKLLTYDSDEDAQLGTVEDLVK